MQSAAKRGLSGKGRGLDQVQPPFRNAREALYYIPISVCAMPPGVELSDEPGIGPGQGLPCGPPGPPKPDVSLTIWSMLLSVCV